jgi:hypothetical protein
MKVVTINEDSIADSNAESTYSDNNGLETQGFIYEEPSVAYWKDKNRLNNLGAFSNECRKKMKCIHFILPNMLEMGQATTSKQATVPHYQTTLAKIRL